MSLSSALATAKNSLKTSSGQLAVVSQNIAGAQDQNYTKRTSHVQAGPYSHVYATVVRESNPYLLNNYIAKSSQSSASTAISNGLDGLYEIYGADDYSGSPSNLLSDFQEALQFYANNPTQTSAGDAAIDRARDVVTGLNAGAKQIETLRNQADEDIQASVEHVNDLLKQFQEVDAAVQRETQMGGDAYSYMDKRDSILKELSAEIGITTITNSDGSMTIHGLDGSTLYDKTARKLTFDRTPSLTAGVTGNQVYVDGVPLNHSSFTDPNGSGNIGGLLKFRDEIAPQYQKQLDVLTSGLVDIFDGLTNGNLFTIPTQTGVNGLSASITLNPTYDSSQGGLASNIGDDIQSLVDAFDSKGTLTGSVLEEEQSLLSFASNSLSWLDAQRSNATTEYNYQSTMFSRASEALSNATGVNVDDENVLLIQLEQSYSATARIITTVNEMLDEFMAAI